MSKTKYPGVFIDAKGNFYYETELGTDRMSGKRVRKKGRKDSQGMPFSTAFAANKELTRVKREYHEAHGFTNFRMTYRQFMKDAYIPAYKTDVEESTFAVRNRSFDICIARFGDQLLRDIDITDVQNFRTWLLTNEKDGGAGYSQGYAGLVFGCFRKSLDHAVQMQYLSSNVSKRVKAIPKAKSSVPFWTKAEFEQVIAQICIDDIYGHLNFVMVWLYFLTGVRVNEGTALWWRDVDLAKKQLHVDHMLVMKNRHDWERHDYTKTDSGKRILTLDDDTVAILRRWREVQVSFGLGGVDDFIMTYDGLPMTKSTISRIIHRYAKLAQVHPVEGKGLRHSHASYLINEFNVSVLVLSKRLGHSSPEITLKHYSHLWGGLDANIAEQIAGNITIKTAGQNQVRFVGNQAVKYDQLSPAKLPAKTAVEA
ncbi:tyrosine-type recombinase/integrase [Lapidilactobacillus dextrinicus]|uniref:tyrosine-type recombinase/integrase n=1 Tax=Lapidilactobacillus dextrinicus TaxID=51664 RepID=UPI003F2922EA